MPRELSGIIGLITDYGLKDPYVGSLKASILSINPRVSIVDISHEVSNFDVAEGAYILLSSYKIFPRGTVFVVVVDPGVGSSRKALLIETTNYYFIGPDNGVLRPAADEDGILRVINLTNDKYFRKPVSPTFHGRDIFGPVAAYLTLGVEPEKFGEIIDPRDITEAKIDLYCDKFGDWVKTYVIYIDKFGNAVTGCRIERFFELVKDLRESQQVIIRVRGVESYRGVYYRTFSLAKPGEIILYTGSTGFMEIGVNLSSFAKKIGCRRGDEIWISV
ncbi:MAG: SAM hydrolase/SAM-dependent halogenase family protein [Sulfolobales archaeon]|jgi:S-adenosylmethionine hydrolase